jgi:hypothetical protein
MLSRTATLCDPPVSTFVFHFSSRFVSFLDHTRQKGAKPRSGMGSDFPRSID